MKWNLAKCILTEVQVFESNYFIFAQQDGHSETNRKSSKIRLCYQYLTLESCSGMRLQSVNFCLFQLTELAPTTTFLLLYPYVCLLHVFFFRYMPICTLSHNYVLTFVALSVHFRHSTTYLVGGYHGWWHWQEQGAGRLARDLDPLAHPADTAPTRQEL